MVKVKQTEKVKKERNSSSCANREDVSVLRDLRTTYIRTYRIEGRLRSSAAAASILH